MSEKAPIGINSPIESKKTPDYPREFFQMQVDFAKRVAEVSGIPLNQALLEYTNFYSRFKIGRKIDASNPVWQEFIASINDKDISEQVYDFYLKRKDVHLEKREKKKFGCFDCEYQPEEECVYVHFGNREENGSPLDNINLSKRLEELKHMFEYVKNNCPKAKVVKGSSWLYNLPKYRRFYPPEYTENPKPAMRHDAGLSNWGQFLDKDMQIKSKESAVFKERLASARTLDEICDSMPFKTLKVEAKVENFFRFYGIN
ncbi:hypothetical protein K8Q94_02285 [Candidatus Nomurabacteria bacterium]|nr:hypothetical protein [Candidatus Nomurabacteria bacterium]